MKNLFVLHTQYNLILGMGIMLNRYKEDQNDLIVYAEFTLLEELKIKLEQTFCQVFYVRERYENEKNDFFNIERDLYSKYALIKKSVVGNHAYDNVFISQDRPLESLIVGHCKKLNRQCKFWYIEDGCDSYFSINPVKNYPDYNPGWHTKRSWIIRKLLYGSTYCSDERSGLYIYGQSKYFDGHYVIFPKFIRPQLKSKKVAEITIEEIIDGVRAIYSDFQIKINKASRYVLFFFDLMERYRNLQTIRNIIDNIVANTQKDDTLVLLKYHPRETDKFKFEESRNVEEIPHIIPAEKLLCDLFGKEVTVYGNATTAIVVAEKMGFNTISIAGFENSNNTYMIEQLKRMGIHVPCL